MAVKNINLILKSGCCFSRLANVLWHLIRKRLNLFYHLPFMLLSSQRTTCGCSCNNTSICCSLSRNYLNTKTYSPVIHRFISTLGSLFLLQAFVNRNLARGAVPHTKSIAVWTLGHYMNNTWTFSLALLHFLRTFSAFGHMESCHMEKKKVINDERRDEWMRSPL